MRRYHIPFPGEAVVDGLAERVHMSSRRRPFHRRLTDAVDRAMRHGHRGGVCLRRIIFDMARRAPAAGVSETELRSALVDFVSDHPLGGQLDRVCLADGRRTSERLAEQVGSWVDAAFRTEDC